MMPHQSTGTLSPPTFRSCVVHIETALNCLVALPKAIRFRESWTGRSAPTGRVGWVKVRGHNYGAHVPLKSQSRPGRRRFGGQERSRKFVSGGSLLQHKYYQDSAPIIIAGIRVRSTIYEALRQRGWDATHWLDPRNPCTLVGIHPCCSGMRRELLDECDS